MITLFSLIIICSIWTLGVKIVTSEGMVLHSVGEWAEDKVKQGHIIYEALIVCEWCLPSIHTAIAILFAWGIGIITPTWHLIFYYPLVAMGASMLNGLVWGHHIKQTRTIEYYESQKQDDEFEGGDIFNYERYNS